MTDAASADILIDTDVCQGLGYCERVAAEIFHVDDDLGVAVAPDLVTGADSARAAVAAEELCPTRAISLRLHMA
ncbi:ferredoxin [Nocardioides hwasunensis]|uniref:Ferredoxin n=1 Tax=Nocardioides hwasunensis TaxID=397258 RepID=A0ABR8MG64_9ACTN|nr:ferredoxin [Nocardioides hwasunensis]MBD3915072.1 ferredoxin [Nocardioides hwasunensis]